MFRNYLITALRNLRRNKIYTILNVFGLALGIGCALVIFKVIQYENSFDLNQTKKEEIYRIVIDNIYPDRVEKSQGTQNPVGPALKADYPEIKHLVRTYYPGGDQLNVVEDGQLKKFLLDDGIAFTESSFFDLFDVVWVAGDQSTALSEPQTVVVCLSQIELLFGLKREQASKALGRTINFASVRDFTVVGVIEDPVEPTVLPFKYLFEFQSQEGDINPYFDNTEWHSTSSATHTYFIPNQPFNKDAFEIKLVDFAEKYLGEGKSEEAKYVVQPFEEIAFDDEYGAYSNASSIEFLFALGIIGLFLVLTASINFVNLATAQAANRAKEIGVRKAIGGKTNQLVIQFLSEIAMITLFALIIALAIAEIMFKSLVDIIGYELSLDLMNSPQTIFFMLGLFVCVTLLSGFYPAVLLSRMNAIDALKKKISGRRQSGSLPLRKGLVTLQFSITQFLIIGTLIVSSQTEFFLNKDLGFDKEAIISSYLPERDSLKLERFKAELLSSPAIMQVSYGLSEPTGNSNSKSNFNYAPLESEKSYHGNFKAVDEDYLKLFQIGLVAGRGIEKDDGTHIVVNKKVVDLMGFKDRYEEVIGETLDTGWGGEKKIVGVIENFHTYSLEEELDYVIMLYAPRIFYNMSFKASSIQSIPEATTHFEKTWEQIFPKHSLNFDFYDQSIAKNYEEVQNITSLLRIFAGVSLLIGCFGLYGLISFMAMNKTKEIGVRKVLGASIFQILSIFSKEVIVLMTIAFVITTPIAAYLLSQWLGSFAYSIDIEPEFFAIAFVSTLLIAILTISYTTISTARINPADTLKDD